MRKPIANLQPGSSVSLFKWPPGAPPDLDKSRIFEKDGAPGLSPVHARARPPPAATCEPRRGARGSHRLDRFGPMWRMMGFPSTSSSFPRSPPVSLPTLLFRGLDRALPSPHLALLTAGDELELKLLFHTVGGGRGGR